MSNSRRSVDRGVSDRERASRVAGKPLGEGHHRPVRHFDAAEAVPFTEFYAQAEPVVCADHPSANVLGVAETAEGHGFSSTAPARLANSRAIPCSRRQPSM